MENPLLEKIETSKALPTMPHILLQLIDICNQEEKGIRDLSKVINKDPSISERLLRLVNSAYYSLKQKITSIDQALLLLGMDAVKNIAISSSVYQVFHRSSKKSAFNLKLFWWHSLCCATIARRLALHIQYPSPDEAFLAGLMHDIGKIVLWNNFESQYESILKASAYRTTQLIEGEQDFGLGHAEAGAWLIRRWDPHSFMPDAVLYHHDQPDRILHASPLVQTVYVANRLCPIVSEERVEGITVGERILGLTRQELENLIDEVEKEVQGIAQSLEIEISTPAEQPQALGPEDRKKYEELAGWVRDISLLQSFSEAYLAAEDGKSILQVMRQGMQLLFDLDSLFYFQYRGDSLLGVTMGSEDQEDVIRDLSIPFREETSLLVKALVQQRIVDTFDNKAVLSILDEQLVRFLGAEGMVCLPMRVGEDRLGVLIIGIQRSGREVLYTKRKFLTMFLNLASLALFRFQTRQVQVERIREERMSATSLLAKKVVHEAHNPLGIINNYLSILAGKLSGNESAQEDLRIVREEIRRVTQIIGELSSFSQGRLSVKEPVDINGILRDLARISQESLQQRSKITLELNLDENIPLVSSDSNKLKQVFINLLKNAVEAMSDGGTISFDTRHREGEPPSIEVLIRDQGSGIPETLQPTLFEPYTSSKGHEGLGLSIVHSIVKELGGRLTYETGNKGTTFLVQLPL
ncbi:MAG: HDOD domain-containing protein [Spirochaetaceae bacterium]|nr:MAG: HDOD domain-containing protein [Spirochaetaceae bacterium]